MAVQLSRNSLFLPSFSEFPCFDVRDSSTTCTLWPDLFSSYTRTEWWEPPSLLLLTSIFCLIHHPSDYNLHSLSPSLSSLLRSLCLFWSTSFFLSLPVFYSWLTDIDQWHCCHLLWDSASIDSVSSFLQTMKWSLISDNHQRITSTSYIHLHIQYMSNKWKSENNESWNIVNAK